MKKISIPIDQQVVDLETARELTEKLKSVGIEVEGYSVWSKYRNNKYNKWQPWAVQDDFFGRGGIQNITLVEVKTYTLPELLGVLPGEIIADLDDTLTETYSPSISKYTACYVGEGGGFALEDECFVAANPVTAAARLIIWCIDNGYIKG